MVGASIVTRSIIDEPNSWDIRRFQREGESGLTQSIIYDLYFSDTHEIKW